MENSHEVKRLGEFRTRKVFSLFPFVVLESKDYDFVWTGKWCKWITIKEEKIEERHTSFDDGWTYSMLWGPWSIKWEFISIIDDENIQEKI